MLKNLIAEYSKAQLRAGAIVLALMALTGVATIVSLAQAVFHTVKNFPAIG